MAWARFKAPTLFNPELLEFFANAYLGPLVTGEIITRNMRKVPDKSSLQPTDEVLNTVLYFTQPTVNGMSNPLYEIATPGTIAALFTLYAYYNDLANPNDLGHLKANDQMKDLVKLTLADDVRQIQEKYLGDPFIEDQLKITQDYLISAYYQAQVDSNIIYDINGFVAGKLFNPANFTYAYFSKILAASRIRTLSQEELDQLTPEVTQVYAFLFPEADLISADMVLEYQYDVVRLAKEYFFNAL